MASPFWFPSKIRLYSFSIPPTVALISRKLRPIIPHQPLHLQTVRETKVKKCKNVSSSSHMANPSTGSVDKEISYNENDDGDHNVVEKKEEVLSSSWIDLYLSKKVSPYAYLARLHKLSPTWSIALASPSSKFVDIKMLVLFGLGSLFIRSVGCVINDIFDRDIDAKVERTKSRPLANGLLTPFEGLKFLGFLLLLYLGFLLQLNNYRVTSAAISVFLSSHEEVNILAYLGVAFNWGALLGWAAIQGSLNYAISLTLYLSGVFWTLAYDTTRNNPVGVKSTAILFGDQTKIWISGFGVASIITLSLSGYNGSIGWSFYAFLVAASAQLAWQIWSADLLNPADCRNKFLSNTWYGAIVFGGILFGRLTTFQNGC
ncbi:hypothetical protein MKX03_011603 [Papaver bracteatum]|nr:hypothetical protein MKX03_011603 [Papaver bracteatum]